MPTIVEQAAAKINLTLEILGRRADGYHELESLVAFADTGDRLELEPDAPRSFLQSGPAAASLSGTNLVETAMTAAAAEWPGARIGRVTLDKHLPVAAGLGGGSADAAAALRAIARANSGLAGAPDWSALARRLGADVPVCLGSVARIMTGLGERLSAPITLPPIAAVLANPGVPLATAEVFAALGAKPYRPDERAAAEAGPAPAFADREALLSYLRPRPNSLEPVALRLRPVIRTVLDRLIAESHCRLARLSGSGPTCFGLFDEPARAAESAAAIAAQNPGWWVRAVRLS